MSVLGCQQLRKNNVPPREIQCLLLWGNDRKESLWRETKIYQLFSRPWLLTQTLSFIPLYIPI